MNGGEYGVPNVPVDSDDVIAALREPFLVLDGSLRVQSANASYYRTFYTRRDETDGRFLHELGNGQWDSAILCASLKDLFRMGSSSGVVEVDHEFPSIGRRLMLLHARRMESPNGSPPLVLLAMEDVTERRSAMRALRTSEGRYRRLFESAKDGILILDATTGEVIDANPYMTELLGYSHEQYLGKQLWQIGVFADRSENEAAFRALQEHEYVRYEHLPLQTVAGGQAEVEFVSNVYRVNGDLVAQCNVRDISERTRLERLARDQAAELAELNRRKDEFLAMLSQELRDPLAPIMHAVQLLRLDEDRETVIQHQARAIIARQTQHLKHLVDDLMEVARITTGMVRLRLETVDLRQIVARAVETISPIIHRHQHELTVSVPDSPIWLHADATRLEQVIVNLLANAVRFTEDGGQIWLSVETQVGTCVLRVRDSGIGMASDLLPRIFELFTQDERAPDLPNPGLGVGLSLVQRLTELHGGTVEVLSIPGEGSEFVVRLPLEATQGATDDTTGPVTPVTTPFSRSRPGILPESAARSRSSVVQHAAVRS
jgi:PAS domain S-box-containing protein